MRIAYGDLIGGISGDMFVGAMLDLGLSLTKLKSELKKIPTLRYTLTASKKTVHSIRATSFSGSLPGQRAGAFVETNSALDRRKQSSPQGERNGHRYLFPPRRSRRKNSRRCPRKSPLPRNRRHGFNRRHHGRSHRRARTRYRRLSFFPHSLGSRPDPRSARSSAGPGPGHTRTLERPPGARNRSRWRNRDAHGRCNCSAPWGKVSVPSRA